MSGLRLDEDHHVHSVFSDDAVSTVAENVAAAAGRGLRVICLAEHVRRDSVTVPAFVAAVGALAPPPGLRVIAGVEAKILHADGRLDLPARLDGIDIVLIADHQFPSEHGPLPPGQVREMLADGQLSPGDAVASLVAATAAALGQVARAQLAHLFSILPKIGLAEADVPDALLAALARRAAAAGALVEANEKWGCPSARVLAAFAAAGVPVVAGTDSHRSADVGVYRRVARLAGAAGVREGR